MLMWCDDMVLGDVYADLTSTYVTNQPQGPIEGKAHQDSKSSDHIQILTLTVGWPTGPHLISFRPQARNVALQATMTVTDGKRSILPMLTSISHFNYVVTVSRISMVLFCHSVISC